MIQTGKKLGIDDLLKRPKAQTWQQGLDGELGRLSNGIPGTNIDGSNTIDFIAKKEILRGSCMTYANMVCDKCLLKKERFCVRLTNRGDKLIF